MHTNTKAVILGASIEQFSFVSKYLSAWECFNVPLNVSGEMSALNHQKPDLIILYARKECVDTVFVCENIRRVAELSNVPLLLVISRYQMDQAHAIKDIVNANYIIAPFSEAELQNKTP